MARENLEENSEAALRSARYRLARETAEEPIPADEYAQQTGRTFGAEQAPAPIPRFHADDEVWEVANSVLDAAFARGDFDNLAYAGKPIPGLGTTNDPDWWVKGLLERENVSGLGPPALLLRKEDQELEATLDQLPNRSAVREALHDFNSRIIEARRQLLGGPPVITALRDIDEEIKFWEERRSAIHAVVATDEVGSDPAVRAGWLRRFFTSHPKR